MTTTVDTVAESAAPKKRERKTLSPKWQKVFEERGKAYHERLVEITGLQLKECSNPVVFLSGGVESSTILWSLLEQGVKPGVITFKVPTSPLSKDGLKAKHMAEFYGLQFNICELTPDPDELAMGIAELGLRFQDLDSRPDYECIYIYNEMIKLAGSLGYDAVFCGVGEIDSMYFNGRNYDIQHAAGTLSQRYMDTESLRFLTDITQQTTEFVTLSEEAGVLGCLPMANMAAWLPYVGVPKEVLNFGGKKNISVNAYRKWADESNKTVIVGSMQLGNTGSREYFDNTIAASKKVDEFFNKTIDSSTKLVNAMNLHKSGELARAGFSSVWSTYRQNLHGVDNHPHRAKERFYEVDKDGLAIIPESWTADEENLFDDTYDTYVTVFNEDGTPDRRMDCWGNPFFEGDEITLTKCKRAMMGLCGSFKKEDPVTNYPIVDCQYYDTTVERGLEMYDELAESYPEGKGFFMTEWRKAIESRYEYLRLNQDWSNIL